MGLLRMAVPRALGKARGPYDGGYAGTRAHQRGIYALMMFLPYVVW